MSIACTTAWLVVFVAVLAFGAAGIRLALVPRETVPGECVGPMDRAATTLYVIAGICTLTVTVTVIALLPVDAAF